MPIFCLLLMLNCLSLILKDPIAPPPPITVTPRRKWLNPK